MNYAFPIDFLSELNAKSSWIKHRQIQITHSHTDNIQNEEKNNTKEKELNQLMWKTKKPQIEFKFE